MATLTKAETKPTEAKLKPVYLTPAVDIRETKDGFILEAEMAGVGKDGFNVTVDNNELGFFLWLTYRCGEARDTFRVFSVELYLYRIDSSHRAGKSGRR